MLISEIRLLNLKALIAQEGTIAAVAEKSNTSPAYLSQIINSVPSSTGTPRSIGNGLARKIEEGFFFKKGWMDAPHDSDEPNQRLKQEKPNAGNQEKSITAPEVRQNQPSYGQDESATALLKWFNENSHKATSHELIDLLDNYTNLNRPNRDRMIHAIESALIRQVQEGEQLLIKPAKLIVRKDDKPKKIA